MKNASTILSFVILLQACTPTVTNTGNSNAGSSSLKSISVARPTAEKLEVTFGKDCAVFIRQDVFLKALESLKVQPPSATGTNTCGFVTALLDSYHIKITEQGSGAVTLDKTALFEGDQLSESIQQGKSYNVSVDLFSTQIPNQVIFESTLQITKEELETATSSIALRLVFETSDFAKTQLGFSQRDFLDETPGLIDPAGDLAQFEEGKTAFTNNCARCHVAEANGGNKAHIEGAKKVPDNMIGVAGLDELFDFDILESIDFFLSNRQPGQF